MTGDIVVGVDGSPGSRTALAWGFAEAARRRCGLCAVVGIGSAIAGSGDDRGGAGNSLFEQAAHMLRETVTETAPPGTTVRVTEEVVDQPGADALLTVAHSARMIVVGARGRGLLHRLRVGSVSASVAVHSPIPVVIARGEEPGAVPGRRPRRVAVGVDGSPNSLAALEWAAAEADQREVGLLVVHAWLAAIPLPFAEAPGELTQALEEQATTVLDDAVAQVRADLPAGLDLQRRVVPNSPTQALLAAGRECDLVVVGARGHGGFAELLLGSVSHQCMLHCPVPVAIIRRQ
ncbi:Universal stress protein UspA-like protein [Frankia canadensis]|uniref:Universal stress protein UspA-like protein n=1 Tax=Frankia canadensis TaxID=1836972 RepID=A0A2I2KYT0_9ACTN|nr:universal stress protein [Frankia canadensis]SNQ50809.1 Universal stress protein UspA-like protein [Frankia canadensis]SOU58099.1 Universal stress protein UspA-like protein [Frankia canadensis]